MPPCQVAADRQAEPSSLELPKCPRRRPPGVPRAGDAERALPHARRPLAEWDRARPVPTRTGDP
jgi:hypothetical protein